MQQLAPPYTYVASGLAGDGLGGTDGDWYQFNVNAGDNLVITTTTPGDHSGHGLQFATISSPTINLYDPSGNLVATATGDASRRPQRRHRLDGIYLGQLPGGDHRREPNQPG